MTSRRRWPRSSPAKPCPCKLNAAVPGASTSFSECPASPELVSAVRDPSRPRPVVLVIDDELGVRESFRLILDGEFEVLEAEQGVEGLEVLRSRRVDVVLLDVRMPGAPGPSCPRSSPSTRASP